MTTRRRIIAHSLLLYTYTVLQLSGRGSATRNDNYSTSQEKSKAYPVKSQYAATTTASPPVSPHAFSAEDYDILQDAGSLQQALSIVAYEPQKLDAKRAGNLTKSIGAFEKRAQPLYTTLVPIEGRYYEVPRKHSRTKAYANQDDEDKKDEDKKEEEEEEEEELKGVGASKSVVRGRLHESAIQVPGTRRFDKSDQEVVVTPSSSTSTSTSTSTSAPLFYFRFRGKTPKASTFAGPGNDRNVTLNHKYQNKADQAGSETSKAELDVFRIGKKKDSFYKNHQRPTSSYKTIDRIPRPFSLPPDYQYQTPPVAEAPISSRPQSFTRRNAHPPYHAPYPPRNVVPSTLAQYSAASSMLPLSQEARSPPSPNPTNRKRTLPHPRLLQSPYETTTDPAALRTDGYPSALARSPSRQPTPEDRLKPIAYSFARRPEGATAPSASTAPSRQRRPGPGTNVSTRAGSPPAYQTISRRRQVARVNAAPEPSEGSTGYPSTRPRGRVVPEEQNIGHPTIVQPTYADLNQARRDRSEDDPAQNEYNENNEDRSVSADESYNEGSKEGDGDAKGNGHYSYNYRERYEEPIDEEPRQVGRSYKVREEDEEEEGEEKEEEQAGKFNRDRGQYVDGQSTEHDYNYDQARGQNTQHEVAQVEQLSNPSKGDAGDLAEEADHQHKKHHKPKSHDEAEGHSEEGDANEHQVHGEKGHKGYKHFHEHDKAAKGHHDKEGHDHHYDEKEGKDKKHHEQAGYHKEQEKGEEGEKKSAFNEKGDHKKGHSTKGEHVIHKKNEFEKKTEFFDEFHDGGDVDKDGGYQEEHHHKKGGHYKKGHQHEGEEKKGYGEKGKYEKGHKHQEKKGHDEHEGHDQHHHREERHGKKGAHEDAKKWSSKKGERR